MHFPEWKRTLAMMVVGSLFAFGVVRMVQSGEERTRDVIHQMEQSMLVRDAQAAEERHRGLLLLEVVKQSQAVAQSQDYTDRRIEELIRLYSPAKATTQPMKPRTTQPSIR